jgi:hypothetical protein
VLLVPVRFFWGLGICDPESPQHLIIWAYYQFSFSFSVSVSAGSAPWAMCSATNSASPTWAATSSEYLPLSSTLSSALTSSFILDLIRAVFGFVEGGSAVLVFRLDISAGL